MRITARDTYQGHPLVKTPDTEATTGWWYAPALSLHVKIHDRWRAEIWLGTDRLTSARLRILDLRSGAEWLDAAFPRGTNGVAPFLRADRFLLDGELPGCGEWPAEPTSAGQVPMPTCHYCKGPVSQAELLVIGPAPALSQVHPARAAWAPGAHRTCHREHRGVSQPREAAPTASRKANGSPSAPCPGPIPGRTSGFQSAAGEDR